MLARTRETLSSMRTSAGVRSRVRGYSDVTIVGDNITVVGAVVILCEHLMVFRASDAGLDISSFWPPSIRHGVGPAMKNKVALITGVTGQDGSYLAELLLGKGYVVHGVKRRSSSLNTARVDHLYVDPHRPGVRFFLHYGDMTDSTNLIRIIQETKPAEIYNLAAQSHVAVSFETPEYTANSDGIGTLRLLEAIRILGMQSSVRFYQASTSELYGLVREIPQSETTPFYPRSPYAAAKLYAYWITVNYREAYGLHASNGILFNHESPVRGETFVTRKATRAVAAIRLGLQDKLYLGNLNAQRDWGHARDYADGMWRILQQDTPDDYVLATGQTYTVRDFVERAFSFGGFDIVWRGEGLAERGIDKKTGRVLIEIDPRHFRPTEVDALVGDPSKAMRKLGWRHKINFDEIVREMVESDLDVMTRELGVWSQRAGESKVNGERSSVPPPVAARSAGEQLANADDAAGLPARLRALG